MKRSSSPSAAGPTSAFLDSKPAERSDVIRTIVVPVDGSAASEHVLPHVAALCRAVDAGVHVVHVTGADVVAQIRGRDYLKSLEERAERVLPFEKSALRTGEPAVEILKYAAAERADLVAFTTRGASPFRRVRFGTTAIELLRASAAPLLVVRPEWPPRPLRRILAAVDGSRASEAVRQWVADLARGGAAEVDLLRVLLKGDAAVRGRAFASGDPAKSILDEARLRNADLIAVGVHGRRGTDPFFFGSVAESVLLGSEIPVLLFRRARAARESRTPAQGARR